MSQFDFWTPQQIAEELGVTTGYISKILGGKSSNLTLTALKVSGRWLIADADAKAFIEKFKSTEKEFYTPGEIAKAIGTSRTYVLYALTGYGGRKTPRLVGEKRGDRWVVEKEEAERFISAHKNTVDQ
jgi:transcriptional regulator with XRE-family HTH domain